MGYVYRNSYANELLHSNRGAYPNEMIGSDSNGQYLAHWKYLRKYKNKSGNWEYVYNEAKERTSNVINNVKDHVEAETSAINAMIKLATNKKKYAEIASRMEKEAKLKMREAEEDMKLYERVLGRYDNFHARTSTYDYPQTQNIKSETYEAAKDRYYAAKTMLKYAQGYKNNPGYIKFLDEYDAKKGGSK